MFSRKGFKNLEDDYLSFLKSMLVVVIAGTRGSKLKTHQLQHRVRGPEKKLPVLPHRREGHVARSSSVTATAYEEKGIYAWQIAPWLACNCRRLRFPGCLGLLLVCAAAAAPAGSLLGWALLPLLKFPLPPQGVAILLARHRLHRGRHLAMHGH